MMLNSVPGTRKWPITTVVGSKEKTETYNQVACLSIQWRMVFMHTALPILISTLASGWVGELGWRSMTSPSSLLTSCPHLNSGQGWQVEPLSLQNATTFCHPFWGRPVLLAPLPPLPARETWDLCSQGWRWRENPPASPGSCWDNKLLFL